MTTSASRRHFLRTAAALSAAGAAAPIALNLAGIAAASAQSATDYRALVLLYMAGGNDHLGTVVPYDTASYNRYAQIRGGLAQARAGLLPLGAANQGGREAALNSALTAIKAAYDGRRCAVVAGVGPLTAPTTKGDLGAGRVAYPSQIGSHSDQANTWQSLATSAPYGWGGRMGDILAATNGTRANFTTISATGGYSLFLVGGQTSYFTVSEAGAPSQFFANGSPLEAVLTGAGARTNLLEQAYAQVHDTLREGAAVLNAAILPESAVGPAPGGGQSPLANQLQTVARVIGARGALGVRRQVFYVEVGGFDTHGGQVARHAALLTELNAALGYFDSALGTLGLRSSVVLATSSEFGRHLVTNGDGTDHGWAGHHFVLGGAVRGGTVYGALPTIDPQGPDFIDGTLQVPALAV